MGASTTDASRRRGATPPLDKVQGVAALAPHAGEERRVGDGAGASDGGAELDDAPDGGAGVGPGGVGEGEGSDLGDPVDGDYCDAGAMGG